MYQQMYQHALIITSLITTLLSSNIQCWSPVVIQTSTYIPKGSKHLMMSDMMSTTHLPMYRSLLALPFNNLPTNLPTNLPASKSTRLYAESTGIEAMEDIQMTVEERMENSGEPFERNLEKELGEELSIVEARHRGENSLYLE